MAVTYLDLAPNGRIFSVSDLPDPHLVRALHDPPGTTHAPKAAVGGLYVPWGPLGSLGWRGARRCTSGSAKMLYCPNNPDIGGLII